MQMEVQKLGKQRENEMETETDLKITRVGALAPRAEPPPHVQLKQNVSLNLSGFPHVWGPKPHVQFWVFWNPKIYSSFEAQFL